MPQHILRSLHRDRDDRVKRAAQEADAVDDGAELRRKWDEAIAQRDVDNRNAEELVRRARDARSAPERARVAALVADDKRKIDERQAIEAAMRAEQAQCSLCQGGVFCARHTAAGFVQ